ncbi:MAG: aldo/keto reductase [Bacteroidales bacterium]|nr:MAG: aldo/keto reductase [Bacteroidales bacterium]
MKISRRTFINTSITGLTGLTLYRSLFAERLIHPPVKDPFELVPLGNTGIKVPLLSAGTGYRGANRQSNMTRLGKDKFEALLHYEFERGIRFFDCADTYGTHPFVANVLKPIPRDKYILSSKIWFHSGGIPEKERPDADIVINRFLKELNTDYIDLLLMHCLTQSDWPEKFEKQMEIMDRMKEKGIIRSHGISAHSLDALKACIDNPWVDFVHARINAYGDAMDDKNPDVVAGVIKKLHDQGKGIVGMKLIGNGNFRNDPEKIDKSIRYVLNLGSVDTLIIGFEKPEQVDDYTRRVEETLKVLSYTA